MKVSWFPRIGTFLKLLEKGYRGAPINKFLYRLYCNEDEHLSQTIKGLEESDQDRRLLEAHGRYIAKHKELWLKLMDLQAMHLAQGGALKLATQVALESWQTKPWRL